MVTSVGLLGYWSSKRLLDLDSHFGLTGQCGSWENNSEERDGWCIVFCEFVKRGNYREYEVYDGC